MLQFSSKPASFILMHSFVHSTDIYYIPEMSRHWAYKGAKILEETFYHICVKLHGQGLRTKW